MEHEKQMKVAILIAIIWYETQCKEIKRGIYRIAWYLASIIKCVWLLHAAISVVMQLSYMLFNTAFLTIYSLASGRWDYALKLVLFKPISRLDILTIFCEIALKLMPYDLSDH